MLCSRVSTPELSLLCSLAESLSLMKNSLHFLMSKPTPNRDCKRKPKSRAGRQVRQRTIQQLEELKSISNNFEESVPTVAPETPTQISNPQEFKIEQINNFDEFSFFF